MKATGMGVGTTTRVNGRNDKRNAGAEKLGQLKADWVSLRAFEIQRGRETKALEE